MTTKGKPSLFARDTFEEKKILNNLNILFKKQRGYEFKMPKPGEPVILILSGGLDSTMLWFHLLHTYKLRVFPIYFTSPLTNKNNIPGEYTSISFFYSFFKKRYPHQVEPIKYMPTDLSFSLTSHRNMKILLNNWRVLAENAQYDKNTKSGSIYLIDYPTRYARFLLSAYEYGLSLQAQRMDTTTVFFGVVPNDAAIGREPTLTILRSLNLYLCLLLGDWNWQVTGPVDEKNQFYYPKEKSIQIARKHHIPLHRTWSCVRPFLIHCGICNACRYRQASFKSSHIIDKTLYLITPSIKRWVKHLVERLRISIKMKGVTTDPAKQTYQQPARIPYMGGRISLHPQVESIQSDDKVLIYSTLTEETVKLNKIGEIIFKYISQKSQVTLASLVKLIARKYPDMSLTMIKKDICVFIEELKTKRVLVEKG